MTDSDNFNSILSIQLWSLRNLGEIEAQLAVAAEAGFSIVETIGGHLQDPDRLGRALAANGLAAPSSHVGIGDLRSDSDRVIAAAQAVGIRELFMPAYPDDERGTVAADWHARGAELGTLADKFAEAGLVLGYHNHFWEFEVADDGRLAIESFFDGARGSALRWQADIAWIARGQQNPLFWLEHYRDLLVSAHVKDQAPEGQNLDQDGWCDVGAGILDWPQLWQQARALGAGLMVLEHDNPADPAAFARNSRDYLAKMVARS
jgi:sugar phosphate isomerase/epimerase